MNASEPIVRATDVRRRFGEGDTAVDALDGVSVDFPKGNFTAVMGPSGSGKSTLMHILAGLDQPTSGSVIVDGTEIADLDDKRLTELRRDKVGFVFQFFNLLPVLSAEENIRLPLSIAGRKPDDALMTPAGGRREPGRPPVAPPVRALGRPAAARGDRPRAGVQARRGVRRRAHRQPGLHAPARRCSTSCAAPWTTSARPW